MCDILPPKMSDRTTDLEASLTSMDWLPKLNVRDISEKAKNEKEEKSKKKTNGDADGDGHSKDGKPPYSYANLITLAINSSKSRKMTLSEIYSWICENFPYYQDIGTGWKNSIRHNLSLNKCFMKVARTKNDPGKGSYWAIDSSPQDEPIPFKRKRHSDEMNQIRYDESSGTSFNSSSGSPTFTPSAPPYAAMTSPEHAGSPSHHSTPLNHFHSPLLPHNDHNNNQNVDSSFNLTNLPLTDLSASFKSFYRSVIEPTSQGFNRSNASICSNDPAVNHSYNSSCSAQSFNNSNSHSQMDHRRHHINHISPLAQAHHHNMTPQQQIHLDSSTESGRMMQSPRTHYTRSRAHDMNNSVTLNQVNKSLNNVSGSGFNFDLSNIESLKNSFMSVNWPEVDLNQFPDFLETMQRADSNDWELDQQTAIDLCSSLSRVFQQSGYGQQYHHQHPSSLSVSTSSSLGDTSCRMNRSYITQPQISPRQQHLSRSIPVSPPHTVSGNMTHMQTRSLSGSAPPPTSSSSMMQQNSIIPPPGYIPPQQQSQQEEIPDTFDWDSIC